MGCITRLIHEGATETIRSLRVAEALQRRASAGAQATSFFATKGKLIAGAVAGCIALIVLFAVLRGCCCCNAQKRQSRIAAQPTPMPNRPVPPEQRQQSNGFQGNIQPRPPATISVPRPVVITPKPPAMPTRRPQDAGRRLSRPSRGSVNAYSNIPVTLTQPPGMSNGSIRAHPNDASQNISEPYPYAAPPTVSFPTPELSTAGYAELASSISRNSSYSTSPRESVSSRVPLFPIQTDITSPPDARLSPSPSRRSVSPLQTETTPPSARLSPSPSPVQNRASIGSRNPFLAPTMSTGGNLTRATSSISYLSTFTPVERMELEEISNMLVTNDEIRPPTAPAPAPTAEGTRARSPPSSIISEPPPAYTEYEPMVLRD